MWKICKKLGKHTGLLKPMQYSPIKRKILLYKTLIKKTNLKSEILN